MNQPNQVTRSPANVPMDPVSGHPSAPLPLWLRFGIPALLACAAGILNATTVRQQLNPFEALTLARDVRAGERLRIEDLKPVRVGGSIQRELLHSMQSLFEDLEVNDGRAESLADNLSRTPRIFSHDVKSGELLTRSCLAHQELYDDEQLIHIPIAKVRGDVSRLRPGQFVYFDAIHQRPLSEPPKVEELGPFLIALRERPEGRRQEYLPLVYRLTASGDRPAAVETLRRAASSDGYIVLTLVEKPLAQDATRNRRATEQTAARESSTTSSTVPNPVASL